MTTQLKCRFFQIIRHFTHAQIFKQAIGGINDINHILLAQRLEGAANLTWWTKDEASRLLSVFAYV